MLKLTLFDPSLRIVQIELENGALEDHAEMFEAFKAWVFGLDDVLLPLHEEPRSGDESVFP